MRRRALATLPLALAVAGCGFQLRGAYTFPFGSILVAGLPGSAVSRDLRKALADAGVKVLPEGSAPAQAQVVLDIPVERREKVVVGLSAAGQVTEFELRLRLSIRLRTPQGKELLPSTELLQSRDISYSETYALAKEQEENLLYRDMQNDLVQQILRRLSTVKIA
ncbi:MULTISPECIES: LPS assembly lipoprotein LptE [Ramlibacter]|uniref:LPS-assembly lipoprotein LptE n=1 Tax=Ramlibacter aquaticus TaxID=2780094 RepID=A0ABR9SDL0_9BURK|nr:MULTISPECIES: LPS assembly lipoprotein LptE [Ramlibacter]MBE7940440.1 hypothetical protein [Ramlibacter aquaticus]